MGHAALLSILGQDFLGHPGEFRQPSEIQLLGDGTLGGTHGRHEPVQRPAPVLDALKPPLALEDLDLALEHVDGVVEDTLHRLDPPGLRQRIRVFPGRQSGHAHLEFVSQEFVSSAKRGPQAGLVAVVKYHRA